MKTIRDILYPVNQKMIDRFSTAYLIKEISAYSGLISKSYSIPFDIKNGGKSIVYLDCNVLDGVCQPSSNYYDITFGENALKVSTYVNYTKATNIDLVWYVGDMLSYYEGDQIDAISRKILAEQQWSAVSNPK
jgi:hypothetical protein